MHLLQLQRLSFLSLVQRMYSYLYFMVVSCAVTASPLPGAVLCMVAQGVSDARSALRVLQRRAETVWQTVVCGVLLGVLLATGLQVRNAGLLYALTIASVLRSTAIPFLAKRGRHTVHYACAALCVVVGALILALLPFPAGIAFMLGWIADMLLAFPGVEVQSDVPPVRDTQEALSKTHLARSGFRLLLGLQAAVTLGSALIYHAFLLTGTQRILCLMLFILAIACTAPALAGYSAARCRDASPANSLLLGLLLWTIGLLLAGTSSVPRLLGYALSGAGCGLCCHSALRYRTALEHSVRLFLDDADDRWRSLYCGAVHFTSATACALTALLLCLILSGIQAPLTLAAVLFMAASVCLLGEFPLSQRYIDKVTRYFSDVAVGKDASALRAQLVERFTARHPQPLLIRLIVNTVGVFYQQHSVDRDKVRLDPDNPPVYLCNHGDLYGPIASYLTVPETIRPWSISTITDSHETAFAYLYKYDWSIKTWMPVWLRKACAHFVASFAIWGTSGLEAIPVYRDHPVELRKTFRYSINALAAGDPLLIFPENPNAAGQDHGYETTGVGELFSGFAMIAPGYYSRTGKRCRFIPMFAHQPSHTVAFGTEIIYDPDSDPAEERQRISDETTIQMKAMAARLDSAMQRR